MARYSLNPDGSLTIEDDNTNGFVSFGKTIKKITKVIYLLVVLSSIVAYGVLYYNNDPNEVIHTLLTDSSDLSSCYNIEVTQKAIDSEMNHSDWLRKNIGGRIEYGVEWITERISEIRKDVYEQ